MERNEREKLLSARRLERACRYVSDLWFPVNEALLERVQRDLDAGRYDENLPQLSRDLRADPALFTWCLKELMRVLRDEPRESTQYKSPFDAAGIETLKEILSVSSKEISGHSLRSITPQQTEALERMLVSSSAVELLCAQSGLGSEVGYTASALRQLGITLIAWNYPEVYQRATTTVGRTGSLDLSVAEILGYTPTLLAAQLARHWGVSEQLLSAIDAHEGESVEAHYGTASTLAKLCEVGETLARANQPHLYPTAQADWEAARREIESHLGPYGIATIRERFHTMTAHYREAMPSIFRAGILLDPQMRLREHAQERAHAKNPFILNCLPPVRQRLEQLYDRHFPGESVEPHLRALFHEVMPLASCSAVAVFTADPTALHLVRQTVIGTALGDVHRAIPYLEYDHPVAATFRSGEEVTTNICENELSVVALAYPLGTSQRMGVLYLELPELVYTQDPSLHQQHLRAFTQTLNDLLDI